ncbi:HEAT repeat domain-containing protein [Seonamhaeicola algicola]|uniref:HEAT repeat domain-containing protein n=1 Tax=Seonamhaeicola algicola TaxID=1719036 RepID=A0A5C7AEF8_9FLAO|nr:HEAT repeat domain-containing protein [Seonamhaeicola algicola]TXE07116.1 HEAT repeat domain-containing protein [Seonamhaeicola algicola]
MLHHITYYFFKLNIIQPKQKSIHVWQNKGYVNRLEFCLKKGNYKTRKLAAIALGCLGLKSSAPILLHAINDKVQNVSIAALNALENIAYNDNLMSLIIKKRFHWVKTQQEKKAKQEANRGKKNTIYRWERASKKSFDRVKELLKKPIG